MTSTTLRDALAERLHDEFARNLSGTMPTREECAEVASRLLESVPGEEEMAGILAGIFSRIDKGVQRGLTPYDLARFLRSKIGWWAG